MDSVFVEQLWRAAKYEDVYLRAYYMAETLRSGLAQCFGFYNARRRHSPVGRRTPDSVYFEQAATNMAA